MDALLRYTLYQIAFSLLFFEIGLMLFCCLAIIVTKMITKGIKNRNSRVQNDIGDRIEKALFDNQPINTFTLPAHLISFRNLVETLEKYNHLFSDDRWQEIKTKIVATYLLPHVDSYASSFSWVKRQLAARALLLCPTLAKESTLAKLLDDKKYLVRVAAAVCITKTPYKDLFYKMIDKMSQETSLSQFPYRDAIIQCDQEKFHWIASLLKNNPNKDVAAVCLDVLSTRSSEDDFHLIKPFVNDPNTQCQILAIKALGNIPNNESTEILIDHLDDSDWKIRSEAIISLQKLYATQAIPKLTPLLNDTIWWVRLQAALALKNFGKPGLEILASQNKEKTPHAYEIAQYTLALP